MTAQQGPFFRFKSVSLLAAVFAAAAGGTAAQELEAARRDCERLNKHNTAAPADYQPGVDVRGKPVTDSDVDGGAGFELPDTITVSIHVDLAERYNMGADKNAEAGAAAVTVSAANGEVRLNGELLDAETESALRRACLETYGE